MMLYLELHYTLLSAADSLRILRIWLRANINQVFGTRDTLSARQMQMSDEVEERRPGFVDHMHGFQVLGGRPASLLFVLGLIPRCPVPVACLIINRYLGSEVKVWPAGQDGDATEVGACTVLGRMLRTPPS
ncbi:hypothetical protein G7046_g9918 [Stylonectria norvegica]|nr:hypothetical protein G7046_g9918 [Stylonectria norvegica]